MSALTNSLEESLLNHVLRNSAYTPAATVYLALFTAVADGEAGTVTEVSTSGTGYARQAITFSAASARRIANSASLAFENTAGGTDFGTVTHWGIYTASTAGTLLAYGALAASEAVSDGETFTVHTGALALEWRPGVITTYLANKLLDLAFRNTAYSSPVVTHLGLTSTATDDDGNGTELTVTGYSRQSTAFAAPSGGSCANSADETFTDSTATVKVIAGWFLADASTGGNRLFHGPMSDVFVDELTISTGNLSVGMN